MPGCSRQAGDAQLKADPRASPWLASWLDKICIDLGAGREPCIKPDELNRCLDSLDELWSQDAEPDEKSEPLWRAWQPHPLGFVALYCLALRRTACAAGTDRPCAAQYGRIRTLLGGVVASNGFRDGFGQALALACLKADALLLYSALLAGSAAGLSSYTPLCHGPTGGAERRQTPEGQLPGITAAIDNANALIRELLALVQGIRCSVPAPQQAADLPMLLRIPCSVSTPAPSGSSSSSSSCSSSTEALQSACAELLVCQLLEQGVLDNFCRVQLHLLQLAPRFTPVRTARAQLHGILVSLYKEIEDLPLYIASSGLWLGSVAGKAPASLARLGLPGPGCGEEDSSSGNASSTSSTSSGGRSTSSSRIPAAAASSTGRIGRLFPSALQCLLAAHVVRLCAALDGGPTYGLLGDTPGGQGAGGGGGAHSPLAQVPLLDGEGVAVRSGATPTTLGASLATRVMFLWGQARVLWEGSAARDAWWLELVPQGPRTRDGAGRRTGFAAAGSGRGGGSSRGGRGYGGRTANAALAALRRELAEAEAERESMAGAAREAWARAGSSEERGTDAEPRLPQAAMDAKAGRDRASMAGPSSSLAAAAEAASAAAAPPPPSRRRVAALRQTLAALEVEAAAERLPPLNRTATVELCRRLAAAAVARLRGSRARHRIADTHEARCALLASLRCWRLALAPERQCPVRPAPPAVVQRLEAWWRAALEGIAALGRTADTGWLAELSLLAGAGWTAEACTGQTDASYFCGPCMAPLPESLPAGPHPDVAAALSAINLPAAAKASSSSSWDPWRGSSCGPAALLLSSMQRQHGGWCDAAMFGHMRQVVRVINRAHSCLWLDIEFHMLRAAERAPRASSLAADVEKATADVVKAAVLLDAQLLSCLLRLAGLCVNTQPTVDGSARSAQDASQLPGPSSSAPALAAAPASVQNAGPVPSTVTQLGLVLSYTAARLMPALGTRLLALPCDGPGRRHVEQSPRLHCVQCAAGWVVQWLLLLLQVAIVGGRGAAGGVTQGQGQRGQPSGRQRQAAVDGTREPGAAAVEGGDRQGQEQQREGPRPAPQMAAAWRRQLLQQLDVVGVLCGVVRLLAAYPHVGSGAGADVGGLRGLMEPRALAACLDAAAAAFPGQMHAAFCGQGGQGRVVGGGSSPAALRNVRVLLGRGGALEVDGGAWVGSGGSCFWDVVERGAGSAGMEAVEKVVRQAKERAGHVVGLLVPSEELQARVRAGWEPAVADSIIWCLS